MADEGSAWRPPDQRTQPGGDMAASPQPGSAADVVGTGSPAAGARAPLPGNWPVGAPPSSTRSSRLPWIVAGVVALIVVVGLVALGLTLGGSISSFATRTPIEQVAVGQCFDGIRTTEFTDGSQFSPGMIFGVQLVPCTQDHEAELIGRFTWPADRGDTYPGDTTIESFALDACSDGFEEYVGRPFESSRYELTYVYPQQQSWAQGARAVECVVHPPTGIEKEAGSVRNANR